MKERPILFSAPMVRAILDGSKTQTRRVMKRQPHDEWYPAHYTELHSFDKDGELNPDKVVGWGAVNEDGDQGYVCPSGRPRDRLWLRETFLDLLGTGIEHRNAAGLRQRYAFAADNLPGSYSDEVRKDYGLKWKPSIHMPRAASRILLEIVSVRVERLNDCSEGDALAEGMLSVRTTEWDMKHWPEWRRAFDTACERGEKPPVGPLPSQAFRELWNDINGAGSWDANPWVWVVEFKRVTP